jgi:hypothetical protein
MAISMGAALLGSAALGIGGSILGANATKKAAQGAADTSLQTAAMNNALYRDIHSQNTGMMQPFVDRGNAAGTQLNAMLGLPGGPATPQTAQPSALGPMAPQGPSAPANWQPGYPGELHYTQEPQYRASLAPGMVYDDGNMPGAYGMVPSGNPAAPGMPMQATVGPAQAGNAADPFAQYIANSDYGFKFGEGANALNHGLASAGSINSGAAMKAMERFRQNTQAGYRNEYMGYLGQQQGVGLSGASALAGVGQNYAQMAGQNNQNAGDNAANALLMRGAAGSQMWNGIAGGLGNALGSSYMLWGK